MKSRRYDGGDLRRVLIGMVTDRIVCSRIAGQWREEGLFDAVWANLIGNWCVRHVREYGQAPGDQVQAIFESWASSTKVGDETIRQVEKFLGSLSDEHDKEVNRSTDYLLDCAGRYFDRVKIKRAMTAAEEELDSNRIDRARGLLVNVGRVELGEGETVKPAEDYDAWREAFDVERQKSLVSYPGRLDWFLGSAMVRDRLIAFMAPDKTGKSFYLLDLAFRAARDRRRVAYFDTGDQSKHEVLLRLGSRAARHPHEKPKRIREPKSMDSDGKVEFGSRTFDELLTAGEAFNAVKKAFRGKDRLRISCHPNSSINVDGLSSILSEWSREGWVADVVVIDYADILASLPGYREKNDQIDADWRHLKRLSQELHCLVVTATQSNAAAYNNKTRLLCRHHFSGRKTKLAHVDGMAGLNVSPEDKKNGVTRINWVVRRQGNFPENRFVAVAGCLAICNPAIRCAER